MPNGALVRNRFRELLLYTESAAGLESAGGARLPTNHAKGKMTADDVRVERCTFLSLRLVLYVYSFCVCVLELVLLVVQPTNGCLHFL